MCECYEIDVSFVTRVPEKIPDPMTTFDIGEGWAGRSCGIPSRHCRQEGKENMGPRPTLQF